MRIDASGHAAPAQILLARRPSMSELIQHNNASLAAPAKPKFPRPSRRWKAPSKRDLWIFKKIEIEGKTHQAVARDAGIRRSRVTQIATRVRRFLAQVAGDDPRIENPLARQRLELELEKLRFEFALGEAVNAMKLQQVPLVTKRSGSREKDGSQEQWNETVTRSLPPSVQAINTYLRAARELGKLNQRRIDASPVDQQLTSAQAFQAIADILSNWCDRPPTAGDAPTPSFIAMVEDFK